MPLLRAIAIVLGLAHVIGLADLVVDDACEEQCGGDGCDADCPPGVACHCHCPSTMPSIAPIRTATRVDTHEIAVVEPAPRSHANPDPREILHVPRSAAL
ncbi:MAG: hypothetical protein KF773_31245 [Deltaproteobacteria bacterium]|nr:hypothetical protein [Deltaproteobacteria bacterium]MCW5805520.1 hypothetical protein [Deltaproteobacteria bacterium]